MQKRSKGWIALTSALAFGAALSVSMLVAPPSATAKTVKSTDDSSDSTAGMSKEDQAKLKEHNKLRNEITKVKYPATKTEVVSHVKGIKADDKKWFEETLPEKTYESANDVMSALGWEAVPPGDEKPKSKSKTEK